MIFLPKLTRRAFLKAGLAATAAVGTGAILGRLSRKEEKTEPVFIAKAPSYEQAALRRAIEAGFAALAIDGSLVRGKRVLLKPNLVEPHRGQAHINTHPFVVRAAAEAFLSLGAAGVTVAEGSAHSRDTILVLEESGLLEVLSEDRIPFVDLNEEPVSRVENRWGVSRLKHLFLPAAVLQADIVVSLAKMKTHHWAGVTLSMKNLFGVMPGTIYGWPKNVLHWAGIEECVYDIAATVRPQVAIVDGVVGMEGDGPIMGNAVPAGVLVMGRSLPAVDATAARVMGIDPLKIGYLKRSSGRIGSVGEKAIEQRGEAIASVRRDFMLLEHIPAQKNLRLT